MQYYDVLFNWTCLAQVLHCGHDNINFGDGRDPGKFGSEDARTSRPRRGPSTEGVMKSIRFEKTTVRGRRRIQRWRGAHAEQMMRMIRMKVNVRYIDSSTAIIIITTTTIGIWTGHYWIIEVSLFQNWFCLLCPSSSSISCSGTSTAGRPLVIQRKGNLSMVVVVMMEKFSSFGWHIRSGAPASSGATQQGRVPQESVSIVKVEFGCDTTAVNERREGVKMSQDNHSLHHLCVLKVFEKQKKINHASRDTYKVGQILFYENCPEAKKRIFFTLVLINKSKVRNKLSFFLFHAASS